MEAYAKKFESKLQETYDIIDKEHVRKFQHKMYVCAAECCENTLYSSQEVQSCLDTCNAPLLKVQTYLKNEFEDVQNRLQRCLMVCNDTVRDKMGPTATKITDQHKREFEECAINCINKHIEMLPTVIFKIRSTLEQHEA